MTAMGPSGARTASRSGSLVSKRRTSKARPRVALRIRAGSTIAVTMPLPNAASKSSSAWYCARRCDVRQPVRATAGLWPDARCQTVGPYRVRQSHPVRLFAGTGTGGSIAWGSADSGCRLETRTRHFLRRGASPVDGSEEFNNSIVDLRERRHLKFLLGSRPCSLATRSIEGGSQTVEETASGRLGRADRNRPLDRLCTLRELHRHRDRRLVRHKFAGTASFGHPRDV